MFGSMFLHIFVSRMVRLLAHDMSASFARTYIVWNPECILLSRAHSAGNDNDDFSYQ